MKAILQRVTEAKVEVDSKTVGEIGTGFLILLGVENGDTEKEADALAAKIAGLRIFTDENDKNESCSCRCKRFGACNFKLYPLRRLFTRQTP